MDVIESEDDNIHTITVYMYSSSIVSKCPWVETVHDHMHTNTVYVFFINSEQVSMGGNCT